MKYRIVKESTKKQRSFEPVTKMFTLGPEFTEIKNSDNEIVDYKDVKFSGYLSVYGNRDRDGDIVTYGAFSETIEDYAKNPILLRDHNQGTEYAIGKVTKMMEDEKGVYIEGVLSNAPDVQNVRFKVAEGILKTMSWGGYGRRNPENLDEIEKVVLLESSIVVVPANKEALIN